MTSFLWQNAEMRGKTYNFADMELKDIIIGVYQFGLVALTVSGLIFASYSVGRHVLKKYGVPGWYFLVTWFLWFYEIIRQDACLYIYFAVSAVVDICCGCRICRGLSCKLLIFRKSYFATVLGTSHRGL